MAQDRVQARPVNEVPQPLPVPQMAPLEKYVAPQRVEEKGGEVSTTRNPHHNLIARGCL